MCPSRGPHKASQAVTRRGAHKGRGGLAADSLAWGGPGHDPYHAPAGWALALLALTTDRATSGVGGASVLKLPIYYLSLAAGWAGVVIMQAALRYDGASRGVIGVFTASSPLLVAGVVLVAGTAAWLNWYLFGLGIWLIAVAAFSGFAGPAGAWGADALAVGIPFLLMAAITLVRSRA
jgi:hypothetical protein